MPIQDEWAMKAANPLNAELKRKGVTYSLLVEKLETIGISKRK